jgi:hypothetical protein
VVIVVFVAGDAADLGLNPELVLDGTHGGFDARVVGIEKMEFEDREERRIKDVVDFEQVFGRWL